VIILSKEYLRSTRVLSPHQLGQIVVALGPLIPTDFGLDQCHLVSISSELKVLLFRHADNLILLQAGEPGALSHWLEKHIVRWDSVKGRFVCFLRPAQLVGEIPGPPLFRQFTDRDLVNRGVPEEQLPNLRKVSATSQLARLSLPGRCQEKLLGLLSARYTPYLSREEEAEFDGQQYFVASSLAEVQSLLSSPMEDWAAFLHPHQRDLAQGHFAGPVLVTGGAGTGKTVVAMHRARELARQGKKVLLTCYSRTLKENLEQKLRVLCTAEELARISTQTLHQFAKTGCSELLGIKLAAKDDEVETAIEQILEETGETCVSAEMVISDFRSVIRPRGLADFEMYCSSRVGRGRPMNRKQKRAVWTVVEKLLERFHRQRKLDFPGLCQKLADYYLSHPAESPFEAIVADEIQDFGPCELRLLRALVPAGIDDIMLFGDAGQRIFQSEFSLPLLGFEVADRTHRLSVVYRTTEEIRQFAEAILPELVDDLGGGEFDHGATVSLLSGPSPQPYKAKSKAEQAEFVVAQIQALVSASLQYKDFAVFARTKRGLEAVRSELLKQSIPLVELDTNHDGQQEGVRLGTMHVAKGLEFKVVFVVDASKDQLPNATGLNSYQDETDRQRFLEGERNLLYVSVTRARDQVFISYVKEPSEYLKSILGSAVHS